MGGRSCPFKDQCIKSDSIYDFIVGISLTCDPRRATFKLGFLKKFHNGPLKLDVFIVDLQSSHGHCVTVRLIITVTARDFK